MAKQKNDRQLAVTGDSGWLSLKEAARLCNTTPTELRNLIERGKLRAFTVQQGGKTRFRLLRSSLIEAGLIGKVDPAPEPPPAEPRGTVDLLPLIRDQNARISALEDQRANLAGQLGVALERLRAIDERLTDLETHPDAINMYLPASDEKSNGKAKGKRGLKKSFLKVVAVTPAPRRWKREPT